MRSSLPRAGPGCAGTMPGRKSAGATLKEREGLSDGVSHKKQGHPGYCLLDRAGIQSETTPLRPGVQDAQRGRGGAPSNKTSSLKDRFQGCPRHARQSTPPHDLQHRDTNEESLHRQEKTKLSEVNLKADWKKHVVHKLPLKRH